MQERLDENPKHRTFSWHISETDLTNPSLLSNARRGAKITWGALDYSPVFVNWNGLDLSEQAEITPTLEAANNWIIFTHPLGPEKSATPRSRLAPRESSIPKVKPVGREGGPGGRQERTNLPHTAWTPTLSVDQSAQHDFRLQHLLPGGTSSDENRKRCTGYAI